VSNNFKASTTGDTLSLMVYDDIGPEWMGMVSAETVVAALDKFAGTTINVRINSPGGDVFEANAIYNALLRHGAHVEVDIDGLAASAASVIAMAGNVIRCSAAGTMMIHDPWAALAGNSRELRKTADTLDKVGTTIAEIYAARTGLSLAKVRQLMADETWFSATEAVAKGFADCIGQKFQTAPSARVAAGRYRNTPAALLSDEKFPRRAALEKWLDENVEHPRAAAARAAAAKLIEFARV
jgi:ATP-dependent Clp protease, protease subunit